MRNAYKYDGLVGQSCFVRYRHDILNWGEIFKANKKATFGWIVNVECRERDCVVVLEDTGEILQLHYTDVIVCTDATEEDAVMEYFRNRKETSIQREAQAILDSGKPGAMVQAVKYVRDKTGRSLKDAKYFVDSLDLTKYCAKDGVPAGCRCGQCQKD